MHQFANLAFGGKVVWGEPIGSPDVALRDCRELHGPHGIADWLGNLSRVMFTGARWTSLLGHDTHGYPSFTGWPAWDDYTHQSAHAVWLRRAVDGGLRLVVVVALNNEVLCRLARRRTPCSDVDAIDLQVRAAFAMQESIDDSCGGPGRGWYRIVRSAEEARDVIKSGRLAVVLGIEVDNAFASRTEGELTEEEIVEAVNRYYRSGVRHVIPFHFADNACGGAAFALPLHWSSNSGIVSAANPLASLPVYRMNTDARGNDGYEYRGSNCNARGLTRLGRRLIREMMRRGMVIDVDHMSTRTRSDVLEMATAAEYPVVASHAEFLDLSVPKLRSERQLRRSEVHRIRATGGVVAPLLRQATVDLADPERGTATSFLRAYDYVLTETESDWIGVGTDCNGFAGMPRPHPAGGLAYPFAAPVGDAPMERSTTGGRAFDLNADGVAHIGMVPDFIAELSATGLSADELAPLLRSASGYVDLWERAQSGTVVP